MWILPKLNCGRVWEASRLQITADYWFQLAWLPHDN